jgi:hypothetical protein
MRRATNNSGYVQWKTPNWDHRLSIAKNVLFWTTNEAIEIFSWADNNWLFADWDDWSEVDFRDFFGQVKAEYQQQTNRGEI